MFDPRTGEILDADIMFAHAWVRLLPRAAEREDALAGRWRDDRHTVASRS